MLPNCKVCTRPIGKYGYMDVFCNNCRSFFHRRMTTGQLAVCKYNNQCNISFYNVLNCTACRLKKCFSTGVTMEVRTRKNTNAVSTMAPETLDLKSNRIANYNLILGPRLIHSLNGARNATEFATLCLQYIDCWNGPSPSVNEVNLNIDLGDLLMNPLLCTKRDSAVVDQLAIPCTDPNFVYYLHRSYGRNVTGLADFTNSLKEFHDLDMKERVKLIKYNNSLNAIFLVVYIKYHFAQDNNQVISFFQNQTIEGAPENFDLGIARTIFNMASNTIERMLIEIQPDPREAVLLRFILVLQSFDTASNETKNILNQARSRYISILAEFIYENYSNLSPKQQISRLQALLATIPVFKELAEIYRQGVTLLSANNWGRMGHRLPVEMFIKESS